MNCLEGCTLELISKVPSEPAHKLWQMGIDLARAQLIPRGILKQDCEQLPDKSPSGLSSCSPSFPSLGRFAVDNCDSALFTLLGASHGCSSLPG